MTKGKYKSNYLKVKPQHNQNTKVKINSVYPRFCKSCGEYFYPIGKFSFICEPCKDKGLKRRKLLWAQKRKAKSKLQKKLLK